MEDTRQPGGHAHTISFCSSDDTDQEEVDENENTVRREPPKKKTRVSVASVHAEFEQKKDNKGVWTSKCRHCTVKETVYKHKSGTALLVHLEKKHPEIYKKCQEEDLKERSGREKLKKEN